MEQENKEPKDNLTSNLLPLDGKEREISWSEPKEEQVSERRLDIITSREYWTTQISTILWNTGRYSSKVSEIEAEAIVDESFMNVINEFKTFISDWQSRYTKLEEENKELRSEIDKHTNQVLKLDKENERLKGKVKELEDLNNILSLRAQF